MKTIFLFYPVLFLLILIMSACSESVETKIIGNWRIDSIYDYHNGFTFTNRDPYPREEYDYRNNNTVLRKGMGEQLEYHYSCKDSVLTLTSPAGQPEGSFIILGLTGDRLVLKDEKKPLFNSRNDIRYEIRYFSRFDSVSTKR